MAEIGIPIKKIDLVSALEIQEEELIIFEKPLLFNFLNTAEPTMPLWPAI